MDEVVKGADSEAGAWGAESTNSDLQFLDLLEDCTRYFQRTSHQKRSGLSSGFEALRPPPSHGSQYLSSFVCGAAQDERALAEYAAGVHKHTQRLRSLATDLDGPVAVGGRMVESRTTLMALLVRYTFPQWARLLRVGDSVSTPGGVQSHSSPPMNLCVSGLGSKRKLLDAFVVGWMVAQPQESHGNASRSSKTTDRNNKDPASSGDSSSGNTQWRSARTQRGSSASTEHRSSVSPLASGDADKDVVFHVHGYLSIPRTPLSLLGNLLRLGVLPHYQRGGGGGRRTFRAWLGDLLSDSHTWTDVRAVWRVLHRLLTHPDCPIRRLHLIVHSMDGVSLRWLPDNYMWLGRLASAFPRRVRLYASVDHAHAAFLIPHWRCFRFLHAPLHVGGGYAVESAGQGDLPPAPIAPDGPHTRSLRYAPLIAQLTGQAFSEATDGAVEGVEEAGGASATADSAAIDEQKSTAGSTNASMSSHKRSKRRRKPVPRLRDLFAFGPLTGDAADAEGDAGRGSATGDTSEDDSLGSGSGGTEGSSSSSAEHSSSSSSSSSGGGGGGGGGNESGSGSESSSSGHAASSRTHLERKHTDGVDGGDTAITRYRVPSRALRSRRQRQTTSTRKATVRSKRQRSRGVSSPSAYREIRSVTAPAHDRSAHIDPSSGLSSDTSAHIDPSSGLSSGGDSPQDSALHRRKRRRVGRSRGSQAGTGETHGDSSIEAATRSVGAVEAEVDRDVDRFGITNVLGTLTPNHCEMLRLLAQAQLANGGQPVNRTRFYQQCFELLLVSNMAQFQSCLTEFMDHQIVVAQSKAKGRGGRRSRRSAHGQLRIPYPEHVLRRHILSYTRQ